MEKKNKKKDELVGFREFIEDEGLKRPRKHSASKDKDQSYQLLTFLERESLRLGKLIDLCEEKVYIEKNYPQHMNIELELENLFIKKQIEIIQRLRWENSPFSQNLGNLLSSHFNS